MFAGEWFNQEGASASLVARANVFDILQRGEHDKNGFGAPSGIGQFVEDGYAIRMRHGQVDEHQGGDVLGANIVEVIEALLSAAEPDERVQDFALAEDALRKQPIVGGIINNEDRLHCISKPHRYWAKRNPLIWLGVSTRERKRRIRTGAVLGQGGELFVANEWQCALRNFGERTLKGITHHAPVGDEFWMDADDIGKELGLETGLVVLAETGEAGAKVSVQIH